MHLVTPELTVGIFLFSTHITRNKIIAIVAVAVVVVVAAGIWLVRRRRVPLER
jgi:hypothetical protein